MGLESTEQRRRAYRQILFTEGLSESISGVILQPELAMGAIGEDGVRVLDRDIVQLSGVRADELREVERREQSLLRTRVEQFRRGRPRIDLKGRVAVIVDDGLAIGSTARAACLVARHLGAARVVLAVPVAPAEAASRFPEACRAPPT
jgi:putative phosphoribosyl transferase